MTIIHWNRSLETGHPMLDADHYALVELVNQLGSPQSLPTEVLAAMDQLMEKMLAHFAREEMIMHEINFRELPAREKEHQRMAEKLASRREELAAGRTTGVEIGRFFRHWFMAHTLLSDQRLSDEYARHVAMRRAS